MNERKLRLWPGVVAVILQSLVWFGLPMVSQESTGMAVIGGLAGGLVVLVWWAFLSKAPMIERWGAIVLIVIAMAATPRILHPSIRGGMMGFMFTMYAIPVMSIALVGWAAATRNFSETARRVAFVATIVTACGLFALLRTDGITGDARSLIAWRWTKTSEQKLLARTAVEVVPVALERTPAVVPTMIPPVRTPPRTPARARAEWPGFRGAHRDGIVTGVRIKTDWASSPPVEMWRRPIGPGWSSFAAHEGLLYTQEQRGDSEVVACYDAGTGEPVWTHRDATRFWESNAGAGPRGTPTVQDARVYTFGATGILNALDANTGAVLWSRNAASDTSTKVPDWGFASSPLVVDDLVIVATAGRLSAYRATNGEPRWVGPEGRVSYSSPHLLSVDGIEQVVLLSGGGAVSVAPDDGKVLWKYSWEGFTSLQPALVDGGVLITTGDAGGGLGTRRLAIKNGPNGWTAEEVWTSNGLKPYFNDFVVHGGYAFGFDGSILACIDLKDGQRKWKGGHYGHGQLLLLRDQDLLLVLSEEGGLALVSATPGQFKEIARFPALDGKTWNHPALTGDILLVRNDQEMVAFRMPLGGG